MRGVLRMKDTSLLFFDSRVEYCTGHRLLLLAYDFAASTMKIQITVLLCILVLGLHPRASLAQGGILSDWERIGQISFTSGAIQGSKVVLTTSHGYLYSSLDSGLTWTGSKVDDTLSLSAIAFVDSLHGVLADNAKTLLRTTNGGKTWIRSVLPIFSFSTSIAYPQKDSVFVSGGNGSIWRSIDGGISWSEQRAPTGIALHTIRFLDGRRGFAGGDGGILLGTTDAGDHWSSVDPAVGKGVQLLSMDFLDQSVGAIGCDSCFSSTTNGGLTWTFHRLPWDYTNSLTTVKIVDSHTVAAFSNSCVGYYSSDLGQSWVNSTPDTTHCAGQMYVSLHIGTWVLVAGDDGTVFRSKDGGRHWTTVMQSPPETLISTEVRTSTSLVASTGSPIVYSSHDAGVTWKPRMIFFRDGSFAEAYLGVHFSSPDSGIFLNQDGFWAAFQTTDGGQTWDSLKLTPGSAQAASHMEALSFSGPHVGYISGRTSVSRTKDGGHTWTWQPIADTMPGPYSGSKPTQFAALPINAADDSAAFLGQHLIDNQGHTWSVLFRTTDQGSVWSKLPNLPMTPVIQGISFRNRNLGLLFCDSSTLYKTTNGGASWDKFVMPEVPYFYCGVWLNDSVAFAGGSSRSLFSTTNAGLTWEANPIPIPGSGTIVPQQLLILDDHTLFGVFDEGFYRATINQGGSSIVESNGDNLSQYLYIQSYPNPATGLLHCRLSGFYLSPSAALTAGIFDLLGRNVIDLTQLANTARTGGHSEFVVDIRLLPAGVYTIKYSLGGNSSARTMVVVR